MAYLVEAVAKVGDLYYSSIQNAVNAHDTGTVQLLSSVDECVVIASNATKTLTLDLNGKT